MDHLEMPTLVLVMPNGVIWHKTTPRAGQERAARNQHSLEDASLRTFGDTAILTGLLITKTNSSTTKEATTVVFVKGSGKWKIASAQWTAVGK